MRLFALLCLLCLTACATEVSVPPPDAAGSADTGVDTAGSADTDTTPDGSAADTSTDTGADTGVTDTSPDTPTACPDDPFANPACDTEGASCNLGTECCCGTCYPSLVCSCFGGTWACRNTDACMIPSCQGAACTSDADCAVGLPPGATTLSCVDGLCTASLPVGSCIGLPKEGCDTHSASPCAWVEPSACPDDAHASLGAAGCYPAVTCTTDSDCPEATYCEPEIQTAPRCYWAEPLCDACSELRGLCVPRGI